ncbi:hypothetical protein [Magnetospirillum molischianum]|uniref:Uncharacterized protein n=1 Tax=Magnetospirillum molischianum DSM 120 TaxID=1150626 RepID=H8FV46_MAGML|nr:hypothetical protein [Magnetospirillum molischianum]CCG42234.1 exported hypothetical protein [Magnetospirillum molischianum DSM 120]
MPIIVLVLYVIACAICGLLGRATAFGFLGHFLLALMFSPIFDVLILIACRPSREIRKRIEKVTLD